LFEKRLDETENKLFKKAIIPVTYVKTTSWFKDMLNWIWPLLILYLLWMYIFKRLSAGAGEGPSVFSFGKTSKKFSGSAELTRLSK